jgi:hypothetical protein
MKTSNFKRIAAAGAMSGALGLAALGLGSGVASADDDAGSTPTQPGAFSSDWQSYLPLLGNIGAFVDLEKLGVPPEVANIGNLGNLGNLGNGQWQNILGLVGG